MAERIKLGVLYRVKLYGTSDLAKTATLNW